jgi:hypothetical protein
MAATFPIALKVFSTFHDYTDVIWAYSVNEIHDEVVAIEHVLGTTPFTGTPYTSFAGAIQDLYANKAPTNHTHVHSTLVGDNQGNDHPQYMQVNGYPGFSRPVAGQNASNPNHLLPVGQLLSFGYQTAAQVEAAVEGALYNLMSGAPGGAPLAGPATAPNFIIQGGTFSGCTDGSGRITVPFGTPLGTVQSFVCTKIPCGAGLPCPPYNWIEAQVTLVGCSGYGAVVQFSHDYSWQPYMAVSLTWIAIGMYN